MWERRGGWQYSARVATIRAMLPLIGILIVIVGFALRLNALLVVVAAGVLLAYFMLRQVSSALGLTSLGGHPQMVRPLVAPMAEGAAETRFGELPIETRRHIRAHAAAADNVAVFFG